MGGADTSELKDVLNATDDGATMLNESNELNDLLSQLAASPPTVEGKDTHDLSDLFSSLIADVTDDGSIMNDSGASVKKRRKKRKKKKKERSRDLFEGSSDGSNTAPDESEEDKKRDREKRREARERRRIA